VQAEVNKATEDKLGILIRSVQQNKQNQVAPDPEMTAWTLSAMGELCTGSEADRAQLMGAGGREMLWEMMRAFPDDVYIQWQGCQAIAIRKCSNKCPPAHPSRCRR
jgi:hypothetical protein